MTLGSTVSKPSLQIKTILKPILPQLEKVEKNLEKIGQESEGILKDSSRYLLAGGGKRLRAALVLFTASISSPSSQEEKILNIATSVELIHAATLVHDDIIDHSVLRRLKPTLHLQYGPEVAVLLGDYLYAKAFHLIASHGDTEILNHVARTTLEMCEGELDQLKNRYHYELTLDEYLSFIQRKTASLIASCTYAGARLAKLSSHQVESLTQFGLNVGLAFQIVDDLLDLIGTEKKLGKTLHTDTGNGKMTLPMILLFQDLPVSEKNIFLKKFRSLETEGTLLQSSLREYRIVEKTKEIAAQYLQRAFQNIESFNPEIRNSLETLSRFIIERDY